MAIRWEKTEYGFVAQADDFDEALLSMKVRGAARRIAERELADEFRDRDFVMAVFELRRDGPQRFIITSDSFDIGVDEVQVAADRIGLETVWHEQFCEIALVTDDEDKVAAFKSAMNDTICWQVFDRANGHFEERHPQG